MPHAFDDRRDRLRELLRQARVDAGLRQADLAKRLGRPQSFVSKYESGERQLDFVDVWELCRALGFSLEELTRRFDRGAS